MAPTAKALREQRAKIHAEMVRIRDEDKAVDASGKFTDVWEKVNADYNKMSADITVAERIEAATADQQAKISELAAAPVIERPALGDPAKANAVVNNDGTELMPATDKDRVTALKAWLSHPLDDPTKEQAEACRKVGINPRRRFITMPLLDTEQYAALQGRVQDTHPSLVKQRLADFRATLTTGSGPAGGYLIPPETMVRNLEINMLAFGGMRQVAETIRTTTGEPFSWPTADDTSNTGAQLGESTSIGSSVDPSFGKVLWSAYKFSSKLILVPYELIQDSFVNLPQVLGEMLGERLGRITNTKYTTGSGASTPKGIVTAASAFSAASATAISADDLIGLFHSVDPAYRVGASFMLHDTILKTLRLLKDGNGNYLWQSGLQMGQPDRLLGAGLTVNQDMDSTISSGKKTILFGQLFKYKIRTVGETRLKRLDERYADTDQIAFVAFIREDGNLLTAGTAPVKYLSH